MRQALAPALVLVAALTSACLPKNGPRPTAAQIEDMPSWKTEEGRLTAWRELARWYMDNSLPEQALDMVQRLREAGQDNTELRLIQGRALIAEGIPDEASLLLESVVKDQPHSAEAWQALGIVRVDQQRYDEAIEALRRSLKIDPHDTVTSNNLGFLLLTRGRCEEAVPYLEGAMGDDSSNARYRNNLAFTLVCTGDHERALKLFRSTSPTEADARYNMGVAFERLDKVPSAILQYQEALDNDPQHKAANEALARLEHPEQAANDTTGDEP